MIKCVFYGTLRRPDYNYQRMVNLFSYGPKSYLYIRTQRIRGFEMYDLGSYPAIKHAEESKSIVVDIFEISDRAHNYIHCMETGAGYYEDEIYIDNFLCKIFVYKYPTNQSPVIESGDWISHRKLNPNEHLFNYSN
jgi:gamma-glutamylcyclotransferase (GGCT)/AIG2-like uncharacterized protein YtfP